MRTTLLLLAISWTSWWYTPDQLGQHYFQAGQYEQAAKTFEDPMWQGTAWYRAGEFEKAAQAFSRRSTDVAKFNAGDAWLMRGKYDLAIACYEEALRKRPGWKEAEENLALAKARAEKVKQEGGDLGDQEEGADEIVFDKKESGGQDTEVESDKATSDKAVQAIWLRQVQTKPADFMKAKFSYQAAQEESP
ncbi:tetratricopeptide repeat protein [Blastopirellula sp. JC732]|uniref:Tetratricopeptide repeat protein n=1 Tax=Blastopirellula sediminis TaxID=2894196 RepID=A0A9X1MK16_9BACT|nr:tetratricopeptide repeat protein [Blastopirellula sediminis]MCC9609047.1 tetratricopeptide repeat protein [Blastopirellula sediminis]MCC9628176.1 tetratricopeptide repeat protein [Blastopirellula sediminis]